MSFSFWPGSVSELRVVSDIGFFIDGVKQGA